MKVKTCVLARSGSRAYLYRRDITYGTKNTLHESRRRSFSSTAIIYEVGKQSRKPTMIEKFLSKRIADAHEFKLAGVGSEQVEQIQFTLDSHGVDFYSQVFLCD